MNSTVTRNVLDLFRLDGRVAIVTGASSGLGVAFARALDQAGATVVLAARRLDRLHETKAGLGAGRQEPLALQVDVSDPAQCSQAVAQAVATFGRVDILINSAGVGSAVPAVKETPAEFRRIMEVNVHGSYWMAQSCARAMQPGSVILNISSILGLTTAGLPQAAYSASKAALIGLTRDLAQQWALRRGIRVNALVPGFFPSEMTDRYPSGYLDKQLPRILLGRLGDPAEAAAAALFLVSDASSYVTGHTLIVDGGFTIA